MYCTSTPYRRYASPYRLRKRILRIWTMQFYYSTMRPRSSLWLLWLASAVAAETCLDEFDQPVTSCTRCLWRGCDWCTARDLEQPNSRLAVGCVVKGTHRSVVEFTVFPVGRLVSEKTETGKGFSQIIP